jgi:hypothetical protein
MFAAFTSTTPPGFEPGQREPKSNGPTRPAWKKPRRQRFFKIPCRFLAMRPGTGPHRRRLADVARAAQSGNPGHDRSGPEVRTLRRCRAHRLALRWKRFERVRKPTPAGTASNVSNRILEGLERKRERPAVLRLLAVVFVARRGHGRQILTVRPNGAIRRDEVESQRDARPPSSSGNVLSRSVRQTIPAMRWPASTSAAAFSQIGW